MLDAVGDRLRIAHTASCDSGPAALGALPLRPGDREEEPLVALGRRQAWAQVRTWDELRPWGF